MKGQKWADFKDKELKCRIGLSLNSEKKLIDYCDMRFKITGDGATDFDIPTLYDEFIDQSDMNGSGKECGDEWCVKDDKHQGKTEYNCNADKE